MVESFVVEVEVLELVLLRTVLIFDDELAVELVCGDDGEEEVDEIVE